MSGHHSRSRSLTDDSDDPITSTNIEALSSKYSAMLKGYLEDPYISHYRLKPVSTSPLMHLGAYLRSSVIDLFIRSFIKDHEGEEGVKEENEHQHQHEHEHGHGHGQEQKHDHENVLQILSIGSGYDTRPFTLDASGHKIRYFEVDYESVCIKKQSIFCSITPENRHHVEWICVAGDLNHFETHIMPKLKDKGFRADLPTLLLAELVLVYLSPSVSDAILRWSLSFFADSSLTFVALDHVLLTTDPETDPFGRMMLRQLSDRSLRLPALTSYPTIEDQESRLVQLGFKSVYCLTMKSAYEELISCQEKKRIERLERLDEWEEWNLLASHYCFSMAKNK